MKKWMVLGLVMTAAVAVGVAYAAIPGSNGVISACYVKHVGLLRVIDADAGKKCTSIETPIAWSMQGPKGDAGPQGQPGLQGPMGARGLQGPQGVPGPAGASRVTFAISPPPRIGLAENNFTHVVSKNLPAGAWAVVGYVNTTSLDCCGDTDDHFIDAICELRVGSAVIGSAADRRIVPDADRVRRSLSLNGGAALPDGGAVSLWCTSNGAEFVDHAQLMFIQVGDFF